MSTEQEDGIKSVLKDINKNINNLKSLLDELEHRQYYEKIEQRNIQNVKDNLIGKLPRKLLSLDKNSEILEFSQRYLGIDIPHFHKKSKPELIGHIVVNIENLTEDKLTKFNDAINLVTGKREKKNGKSFFLQWAQAIKEIELK